MASDYDPAYYARRTEETRQLAARALDPTVKRIYAEMADSYAELASRGRPSLRLVTPPGRE